MTQKLVATQRLVGSLRGLPSFAFLVPFSQSFVLVRLAVRYLNRSLRNPILFVLDILEVLVEDTKHPRFLPWKFDTDGKAF